ncbi:MAG: AbrB/MazE/SpoVT family DNA-binding domain-containing protein [Nitrosopumilus sp.]|nr:AbrB/MazE/SpoVT family DNA-binding domain-containing protein [Nitrosopumilus sp.]
MEKVKNYINSEEKPSTEYEYRKVQGIMGEHSFSIVLPKSYALNIGIGKGDFVKVTPESNKIVVEKA